MGHCRKEDGGEQQKGGKEIDLDHESFRSVLYFPFGPADYREDENGYTGEQIICKAGKGQGGWDG